MITFTKVTKQERCADIICRSIGAYIEANGFGTVR